MNTLENQTHSITSIDEPFPEGLHTKSNRTIRVRDQMLAPISMLMLLILLMLFGKFSAHGQTPSTQDAAQKNPPSLVVSGFADMYYAFAFTPPPNRVRSFTTQPLYHNEFAINLAVLSLAYSSNDVRGRVALQTGSYVESNYAAEPAFWRNVHEASVGVRLAQGVWLDAGILPSHIGFESAISKDNWTYSRSLMADYSPYYETGAKLSWSPNETLTLSALVVNGWQIIRENNSSKSFGSQVLWKPSSAVTVNWSTYVGNDAPDSVAAQMRVFNNFYAQLALSDRLSLAVLADVGVQNFAASHPLAGNRVWWTAAVLGRYALSDRLAVAARLEQYSDPNGVLIPTSTRNNFQTSAASLNLDYALTSNVLWRVEVRAFSSRDAVYPSEGGTMNTTDGFVATSIALSF
jgi:hypothetical protein